jgi:hypothetical protein
MKKLLCCLVAISFLSFLFGQSEQARIIHVVKSMNIGSTDCGLISFENYDVRFASLIIESKNYGRFLFHEVNEDGLKKVFYVDLMKFRENSIKGSSLDTILMFIGVSSSIQDWEKVNFLNQEIIDIKAINKRVAAELYSAGADFVEQHYDSLGRLVYLKDPRKATANCFGFYYELEFVYEFNGKSIIPLFTQRVVNSDGMLLSRFQETIIQDYSKKYTVKKAELEIFLSENRVFSKTNLCLINNERATHWPGFARCLTDSNPQDCYYSCYDWLEEYRLINRKGKLKHLATYSDKFSVDSFRPFVKKVLKHGFILSSDCVFENDLNLRFTGDFEYLNSNIDEFVENGRFFFQCYDEYQNGKLVAIWKFVYTFEMDVQSQMGVYEVVNLKTNKVIHGIELKKFLKNKIVFKYLGDVIAVSSGEEY